MPFIRRLATLFVSFKNIVLFFNYSFIYTLDGKKQKVEYKFANLFTQKIYNTKEKYTSIYKVLQQNIHIYTKQQPIIIIIVYNKLINYTIWIPMKQISIGVAQNKTKKR